LTLLPFLGEKSEVIALVLPGLTAGRLQAGCQADWLAGQQMK